MARGRKIIILFLFIITSSSAQSDKSDTTSFFKKLENMILVKDKGHEGNEFRNKDKSLINKYAGKTIRHIDVKVLNVFGPSIYTPDDTARTWFGDEGNSLHINTKVWLIKNKLIFNEGDKLVPYDIQESERIIRQTSYVKDARIIPEPVRNSADSVDIIVYSQDIWSANGGLLYHPANKSGRAAFNDINFLGYGNAFNAGLKFDHAYEHGWDWDGGYSINNIRNTFLTANINYTSNVDQQQYGVSIGRDFFSPIIKWAGAIAQNWQTTRYAIGKDSTLLFESAKYNQQDYWLGYAFDLKPFDPNSVYQNRFNISARVTRTVFSQKPGFDTMNIFQNNTFILWRLGYSLRKFYQDQYVFGLGKTEDIPLINNFELLWGYDIGESTSMPYYGLKSGYSTYIYNFGYLYGGFQIGAFRNSSNWVNGAGILQTLYFSKLLPVGTWSWRHYIGAIYSFSLNQLMTQGELDLNNNNGIRGFFDNEVKGNKKLVLNYEADIFSPFKIFGFNLAILTFADFGLLTSDDRSFLTSPLYQGYGVGLRVKNENLIFPTFQFMIGIYPNIDGRHFSVFNQNSVFNQLNQYQASIPSVVLGQ